VTERCALDALVERALALVADPETGGVFLDGGPGGRGYLAVEPEQTVVGADPSGLALVQAVFEGRRPGLCAGHVTYDAGAAWLLGRSPRPSLLPPVFVRHYAAWAELAGDRVRRFGGDPAGVEMLRRRLSATPPASSGPVPIEAPRAVLPPAVHRARVAQALAAIRRGDTYQVNLAQPFFGPTAPPAAERSLGARAADLYRRLRAGAPAPLGALYEVFGAHVVSNAPETLLVLERCGGVVRASSRPIKGTRPRGATPAADRAAARELLESAKDRAEHVMIVDLVRNDLGRVARTGTVAAPRSPALVTLPTVHHLESEVTAEIDPGRSLAEVFLALFPGGSVTGAPKRRTVEIIDELEGRARGVYCGAIFVATAGRFVASIPIRTGVLTACGLELLAGGGIVEDSDPEAERLESEVKTRAFRFS